MRTTSLHGLLPRLRAQDISWRRTGPYLEIQLDLHNESTEPTGTATLVIEAAAFGAFIPFEPLARIPVAGFGPSERRRVVVRVPMDQVDRATGSSPPAAAPEPAADESAAGSPLLRTLRSLRSARWVGNLNVYFETDPGEGVELHRALDLKIEAGRKAVVGFFLESDVYETAVETSDASWRAEVWLEGPLGTVLVVWPPDRAGARASVVVRVTRTSDHKTVPVEFEFETVTGPGDTLGCRTI